MATGFNIIIDMKPRQLLDYATPLLQNESTKLQVAVLLAERLQSQTDDRDGVNTILRLLCAHCCGDVFILDIVLDLLLCLEEKGPIINSIAPLAMNASTSQIEKILSAYRDLIEDRSLLVPVIGSMSELRMSVEQKERFFVLVEESLSLVDHDDVPTIVTALLQLSTAVNAITVMQTIRKESARLPVAISAMLADPVVAAMRTRTYCSRAFWAVFKTELELTPLDILVTSRLLQVSKFRAQATSCLLQALQKDPRATTTICAVLSSSSLSSSALDMLYVALQPRHRPDKHRRIHPRAGGHDAEVDDVRLRSYLSQATSAIFRCHPSLRVQTMTALLSACSVRRSADAPLTAASALHDTRSAVSSRGGVGIRTTARFAAAAVLEVARGQAASMGVCAELIVQFLSQHAASVDLDVLHLIAAAVTLMIQSDAQTQLEGGDTPGQAGGVYGSVLLLLQKLLMHPRAGSQRAALVLTGHVLSCDCTLAADSNMLTAHIRRMPFQPSWPLAPHLFMALSLAAGRGIGRDECRRLLATHLRPAAMESKLLVLSGDANSHAPRAEESDGGGHGTTGGSGWAAGQYKLSVHECALRVLASREERGDGKLDSVCAELWGLLRLFECLLVVEGSALESKSPDGSIAAYGREACGWSVTMPSLEVSSNKEQKQRGRTQDEEAEEEDEEMGDEDRLAQHLLIGVSCWLNFTLALQTVRLASGGKRGWAEGRETKTLQGWSGGEGRVLLARLVQGMLCWHQIQHHTRPAVIELSASIAATRRRAPEGLTEGVDMMIRMGWEEGVKCPVWWLAQGLTTLHPTPPGSLPAVLEMLRLINSELHQDGARADAGLEHASGQLRRQAVTWMADKVLTLAREAHAERKQDGSEGRDRWMLKWRVVGECYAGLITVLGRKEDGERDQAAGGGGLPFRDEELLLAMATGVERAKGGGEAGESGKGESGVLGRVVRALVDGSAFVDDGEAACFHLELIRLVVSDGEHAGEVGRLARRMVTAVFPVEGAVEGSVVTRILGPSANKESSVWGRAPWHPVRHLMQQAISELPFRDAVALIDSFLSAAGGPQPQTSKSTKQRSAATDVEWAPCLTPDSVAALLGPALDMICAACDVATLPSEEASVICLLDALAHCLALHARLLSACAPGTMLGAPSVRAAVQRATVKAFALLRRRTPDMAAHAKPRLKSCSMQRYVGHVLQHVTALVKRHARVTGQWGKGAEGAGAMGDVTPRSLLEGELLGHAVDQVAECHHLDAREEPSDEFAMAEDLRCLSFVAVVTGRHSVAAQLTETEESGGSGDEVDDDDADDGFRVVRKKPRTARGDDGAGGGSAEGVGAHPGGGGSAPMVIKFHS